MFALVFRMPMATISGRCLQTVTTNEEDVRVHKCFKKNSLQLEINA
jgi:hypothetical protein